MDNEEPTARIEKVDTSKVLSDLTNAGDPDSVVICRNGICHSIPRAMVPVEVHDFIDSYEGKVV